MQISYKKLNSTQAAQYREIRLLSLQLHPEAYGSTYEEESSREKLFFEYCIENQMEEKFVMGAFTGESLIGICAFLKESSEKTGHRGEIIQVFVLPGHRKKNIGAQLMKATISEARKIKGLEQIELGVATQNLAAINCYKANGFEETGTIKRALKIKGNYIDEYLMVLFL